MGLRERVTELDKLFGLFDGTKIFLWVIESLPRRNIDGIVRWCRKWNNPRWRKETKDGKNGSGWIVWGGMTKPHVAGKAPWAQWLGQAAEVALEEITIHNEASKNSAPHSDLRGNRRRLAWPSKGAEAVRGALAIPG